MTTRTLVGILALGGTAMPATTQDDEIRFHVATSGNDAWSGSLSEPNAAGTDGPFATLERARDAAQKAGRERPVLIFCGQPRAARGIRHPGIRRLISVDERVQAY